MNDTHCRYHNQSCPMVSSAPANHPEQFVIEKCLLPEAVWVRGRGVNLSKYFLSQSLTSINHFKEATGLHLTHTEDHQGIGQKEEDKDPSFITALIYKTPKLCNRIDQLKLWQWQWRKISFLQWIVFFGPRIVWKLLRSSLIFRKSETPPLMNIFWYFEFVQQILHSEFQ